MKRCKVDKNLIQKLGTVFLMKGLRGEGGGIFGLKENEREDRKS